MGTITNLQLMQGQQLSGALSMPGMASLTFPLRLITSGNRKDWITSRASWATERSSSHYFTKYRAFLHTCAAIF